jgi:hypothetical protein
MAAVTAAAGLTLLAVAFFVWFPPSSWTQVPYLDNWATRYRATMDGIALLNQGAASGWNWWFLGGYPMATDITQNLAILAWLPVSLFGQAIGFHLLHAALFLGLPALVYLDVRISGDKPLALVSAGLTAVAACGFSYLLLRSGDTNSLAGLVTTLAAIVGAHASRAGQRWGAAVVVIALTLVAWCHVGFLVYAVLLLIVDAALERDFRAGVTAILGGGVAMLAALPVTWELWRYPSLFLPNNVIFDPSYRTEWAAVARKIFYNVEMLWLPGRWVNDVTGLAAAFLPILAYTAWTSRSRARFHAVAALGVVMLTRLLTPETAYLFLRPVHLFAVFVPVALSGFLVDVVRSRWRVVALLAMLFLYQQIWWHQVPHLAAESQVEPALAERMRSATGALVLVENTFHRDMDAADDRTSEPTPARVHFESLLPAATGQRLYAGMWDGWQWSPMRDRLLSGGAFRGTSIDRVPPDTFRGELARWGVKHLFVWSAAAKSYLDRLPSASVAWDSAPWREYVLGDADVRAIVMPSGQGELSGLTSLGGVIHLTRAQTGAPVIVRTSFHPAWRASAHGRPVSLRSEDGQLAFDAPADGDYDVELIYPRRTWLLVFGILVTLVGSWAAYRFSAQVARPSGLSTANGATSASGR